MMTGCEKKGKEVQQSARGEEKFEILSTPVS